MCFVWHRSVAALVREVVAGRVLIGMMMRDSSMLQTIMWQWVQGYPLWHIMEGRYSMLFNFRPLYSYLSLKWPGHLLWKVRNPRQGGCPFSTVDRHGCAHASRISKTHGPVGNQQLLLLILPLAVLLNFRFFLSLKNKSIIVLVISFSYKKHLQNFYSLQGPWVCK